MKPEKRLLIHDLLDDNQADTRRAVALAAGGRVLRYKRWRRYGTRAFALTALVAFGAIMLHPRSPSRQPRMSAAPAGTPGIPHLTDEQLLALFPDTPVGLAKVGAHKVLIFPRAADRARFIGKF